MTASLGIIPDQAGVRQKNIRPVSQSGTPVRGIQEYLNANSVPNSKRWTKMGAGPIDLLTYR